MVSELTRQFRRDASDPAARANDRKQSALALSILLDKYCILSGRPTQIVKIDSESRDAMRQLADKIKRSGEDQHPEDGLQIATWPAEKRDETPAAPARLRDLPRSDSGNLASTPVGHSITSDLWQTCTQATDNMDGG